jgi:two-component sensor histidine kinase
MQVRDNGIGFTQEDLANARVRGSLGLRLIDALCRQLEAAYTLSGPGTVFTMTFK